MFSKTIKIGAIASLVIEAQQGGSVMVAVQSGPFRALFPLSREKVAEIIGALCTADETARGVHG